VPSPTIAWQTNLSDGRRSQYFLRDGSRWLADGTLVTAHCPLDYSLVVQRFDARLKRLSSRVLVFPFQPQLVAVDPFGAVFTAGPVPQGGPTTGAEFRVVKIDSVTGRSLWPSDTTVTSTYGLPGQFGPSTLALTGRGDVIVSAAGSPDGIVVCFDGLTGGTKWGPVRDPRAAYVLDVQGDRVLVSSTTNAASELSALDGSLLWGPVAPLLTGETVYQDFLNLGPAGEVVEAQVRLTSSGGRRLVFVKRDGGTGAVLLEGTVNISSSFTLSAASVDYSGGLAISGSSWEGNSPFEQTIRVSASGQGLWSAPGPGGFGIHPYAKTLKVAHDGDVLVSFQMSESPFWLLVAYAGETGVERWRRPGLNGLAIGPDGRVLASVYDLARSTLLCVSAADGTTVAGPVSSEYSSSVGQHPWLLGRDPKGNAVAVILTGSGTSSAFKLDGSTGAVIWGPSALDDAADQMAFDASGDVWFLFEASNNNGHAQKLSGATGKSIALSPFLKGGSGQYASPYAIRAAPNGEAVIAGSTNTYDVFPNVSTAVTTWGLDSGGAVRWQRSLSGGTFAFDPNYPSKNPRSFLDVDASGNAMVALASRPSEGSAVVNSLLYGRDGEVLWGPVSVGQAGVDLYPLALAVGPANDAHVLSMSRVAPWNLFDVRVRLDSGSIEWGSAPRASAGPGAPLGILPDGAGGAFSFDVGPALGGLRLNHLRALDGLSIWESLLPSGPLADVAAVVGADGDPRLVLPDPYAADRLWRLDRDSGATVYGPLSLPTDVGHVVTMTSSSDGILALSGSDRTFVTAYREKLTIATVAGAVPPAICGRPYSFDLGAANATGASAFSLVSGALPPGLSLSASGRLGGFPSGAGAFAFRVRVTDASDVFERDFILDVLPSSDRVPILADASPSCPDGVRTLSVAGSWTSYRWLPGGETTPSVRVSPRESTTYVVFVTEAGGCTSRGSIEVAGARIPTPMIHAPFGVVPGVEATATADAQEGHSYAWRVENGTLSSGQGTATITFVAGASGPVTLRVVESDSSGCPSAEAVAAVGSAALAFNTLTPCRVIDTRDPVGAAGGQPLAPNALRTFLMTGACGIPATARVLSMNVIAVSPTADGVLTAFPGDRSLPGTSTLSYRAGQTRANNSIMGLGFDGTLGVQNNSPGSVDLVLDVTGFFE
jgi:hypothetical protein